MDYKKARRYKDIDIKIYFLEMKSCQNKNIHAKLQSIVPEFLNFEVCERKRMNINRLLSS